MPAQSIDDKVSRAAQAVQKRHEQERAYRMALNAAISKRKKLLADADARLKSLAEYTDVRLSPLTQRQSRYFRIWKVDSFILRFSTFKFHNSKECSIPFDVVAYGDVTISTQKGFVGGSSIWLCDAEEKGEFGLYEIGFSCLYGSDNPIAKNLEPTHSDAISALRPGDSFMCVCQFRVFDEEAVDAWIERFAEVCEMGFLDYRIEGQCIENGWRLVP